MSSFKADLVNPSRLHSSTHFNVARQISIALVGRELSSCLSVESEVRAHATRCGRCSLIAPSLLSLLSLDLDMLEKVLRQALQQRRASVARSAGAVGLLRCADLGCSVAWSCLCRVSVMVEISISLSTNSALLVGKLLAAPDASFERDGMRVVVFLVEVLAISGDDGLRRTRLSEGKWFIH